MMDYNGESSYSTSYILSDIATETITEAWIAESQQSLDVSPPTPVTVAATSMLTTFCKSWFSTLPDHLRFSDENMQLQMAMFETCSNSGAWCFCCMHVVHASCTLALDAVSGRVQKVEAIHHYSTRRNSVAKRCLRLCCTGQPPN
jgi:hypothetical protein